MIHEKAIASQLKLSPRQVTAVVSLLDEGNTIPFISRYRKEKTGSLDEEQIRQISQLLSKARALDERRETILATIEEQGKLTPDLKSQLLAADSLTTLEDLYLPYRPKRRTRATIAREKGLEALADAILQQPKSNQTLNQFAKPFLSEEVASIEDALAGARDIVAEQISENTAVRQLLREKTMQWGSLRVKKIGKAEDERQIYELYYDYQNRIERLQPHQILAINRGESEKVLRVKVEVSERDWILAVRSQYKPNRRSPLADQLQQAMDDAAQRLLIPAIERDVRRTLTETAETHAIHVFAQNLRGLLNQPPFIDHTILAIDPAYRTGCKIAVVDNTGKVLETTTIYPHKPQNRQTEALQTVERLIKKHHVTLIGIGNGTASRETEQLVSKLTRSLDNVHYLMVNEAGASVYSASPLARQELPELDVTLRGAVSIARRVQDPLAELVKIDPQSIGVGMYQHDVNQKELTEALDGVVESVVNQVGVDVNTASPALLTHVAGIGPKLAERIVAYRDKNGRFTSRTALKQVSGLGNKAFEQSAGFLRIREGEEPFDSSAIHPESYPIAQALLKRMKLGMETAVDQRQTTLSALKADRQLPQLAQELGTGIPTLTDIIDQLIRPGRDPRDNMPAPVLRSDVLSMEDLTDGMVLKGTVRNVVDFGAFIDIGVKQDGLLHKSQIPRRNKLSVGDVLDVTIQTVDIDRGRISLGWVD